MPAIIYGRNMAPVVNGGLSELEIGGRKLSDLEFISDEPYYSTGFFAVQALYSLGNLAQGTYRQIFQGKVGDVNAQGSNWQLSYADTNNEVGSQFPRDQCFVALSVGLQINLFTSTGALSTTALTPQETDQIAAALSWSYKETGQIERKLGLGQHFPSGIGVYSTPAGAGGNATAATENGQASNGGPISMSTPLMIPIVVRPLVNVEQKLTLEREIVFQTDYNASSLYIGAKVYMYGLRFNAIGGRSN